MQRPISWCPNAIREHALFTYCVKPQVKSQTAVCLRIVLHCLRIALNRMSRHTSSASFDNSCAISRPRLPNRRSTLISYSLSRDLSRRANTDDGWEVDHPPTCCPNRPRPGPRRTPSLPRSWAATPHGPAAYAVERLHAELLAHPPECCELCRG